MAELAKAYVQIIPSTKGIKGRLSSELGEEAGAAGDSAGNSIVSKILKVVAAAKIGETIVKGIAAAVNEGADLEQSIGGIETLFKDSSDTVIANAKNAFKTAGVSANDYMEAVTSFSASLLQGLSGNTEEAAKVSDMALTDMSDNANKMGTSMESIQDAYQGFAKQNYTMLDNLKLGYGGTKTEMERLLADAQKVSGVEYDVNNLADVYNAIHVIQGELGITGTTAEEAATTLTGSMSAMKSAFSNVLGYLAIGEDVKPALQALAETTSTFLFDNLIPMVGNIITALPSAIGTFIQAAMPSLQSNGSALLNNIISGIQNNLPALITTAGTLISTLGENITANLPNVLSKGTEIVGSLADGFFSNLPAFISNVGNMITSMISFIADNAPKILKAGADMLIRMVEGFVNNLPQIVSAANNVVINIVSTIAKKLPQILQSGIEIIGKLVAGLIKAIPKIIDAVPKIAKSFIDTMKSVDWLTLGKNIIEGIVKGIKNAAGLIMDAAKEAAQSALDSAKNALGIHSPSRVFESQVGKMIDLGLAAGIENNVSKVADSMKELSLATVGSIDTNLIPSSVGTDFEMHSYTENEAIIDYDRLANAVAVALERAGFVISVDGRVFGRLVRSVI